MTDIEYHPAKHDLNVKEHIRFGVMLQKWMIAVLVSGISVVAFSGSLSAKPALKDVDHVREGIIATGMAYEISEKCGRISPRYFRAIGFLNSLRSHARNLGYSEAEIEAYIDDSNEKNRLEAVARDRLATRGVVVGSEETYCAVGRAEIQAGSAVGRLLR